MEWRGEVAGPGYAVRQRPANLTFREVDSVDSADEAAVLRAALNDELGYYPAEADGESVDEHRLKAARDAEHLERYRRKYGSPRASHSLACSS